MFSYLYGYNHHAFLQGVCHCSNGILDLLLSHQGGFTVNCKRPVNLDLTTFKFPRMAIVSILHRISGVLLFVFLPFVLYLLHSSLKSQDSFLAIQQLLTNPFIKFMLWAVISAAGFHLIAGIRHLIMDFGYFESLSAGKASATMVFILAIAMVILTGVWIW